LVVLKSVREQVSSQRPIDDRLLIETHVVRVEVHTDHLIIKLVQAESEEDDVALEFLNPKPGLWKAGVVLAACCVDLGVGAAASPLRGAWGALTATPTMQASLFSLTWLFGTGSGLQMAYLMAAAGD
jgi:hypothetical protein